MGYTVVISFGRALQVKLDRRPACMAHRISVAQWQRQTRHVRVCDQQRALWILGRVRCCAGEAFPGPSALLSALLCSALLSMHGPTE